MSLENYLSGEYKVGMKTMLAAIGIMACILGVGVYAIKTNANIEKQKLDMKVKEDVVKMKIEQQHISDQSISLSGCLSQAESAFQSTFELNSTPTKGAAEGVRTWDSMDAKKSTETNLKNDKDLCAKLYGK